MKKHIITIIIVLFPLLGIAQAIKTSIYTTGHYLPQKGMEVYTFTQEDEVLRKLIKDGYILERSTDGKTFYPLQEVHHMPINKIETILEQETDDVKQKKIDGILNYLLNIDNEGIIQPKDKNNFAELMEKKNNRDMGYTFLRLAIMQTPEVAEILGVRYLDKTAESGKTYYYRAKPLAKFKTYEINSEAVKVVANEKVDYSRKIDIHKGDSTLTFSWKRDNLIGYYVERKAYNETVFKPMHDKIQFTLVAKGYKGETKGRFTDQGLENYKPYTYRFYTNTFWGEKVLFGEITTFSVDKTPPPPPLLLQPKQTKPDEITIEWKVRKEAPDLYGFIVARGNSSVGKFDVLHDQILPKNTRKFIDKSFFRDTLNYYVVQAVDTARNASSSNSFMIVLTDSIPPKKPVFTKTTIDKKGVVQLTVKKGAEKDLLGYRLFRANSPNHKFSSIYEGFKKQNKLDTIPTTFTDTITLKTLTPYVYYKIKAVDTHYNESDFSEMIQLKRPDTIPPMTPIFKKVLVGKNKVTLHIILSKSEDVVEQLLYRKEDLNAEWKILDTLDREQKIYVDDRVVQQITYYYSMRAKDDSNLYSPYAKPVFARPYDNGVRTPITNLKVINQEKKTLLSWEYAEKNENTFFVIYKSNAKGQLVQYKRTKELQIEVPKNKATYGIKVFTKDGGQSKMSKTVKS